MLRGIHLAERDGADSCQQENTVQHGAPQASPQPGNASSLKRPRHLLYPHHTQMSKSAGDILSPYPAGMKGTHSAAEFSSLAMKLPSKGHTGSSVSLIPAYTVRKMLSDSAYTDRKTTGSSSGSC